MAGDDLEDRLERETRFTSLLHPNRDLAINWTVDVGKQLEAYLTELASTGIFDDGQCALNFAEAALLIQGSIQVYSRKVEYLYALVLQALNFLGQNKQGQEESSSSPDDDNNADNGEEKEEEFLNLDDVHEESNIDILDEVGVSSVHSAVKIPACLLATDAEQPNVFGEAGELASYEIATSIMHRTFLLLDPCDAETVDSYLDGEVHRAEKGAVPPTPGSAMPSKSPRTQPAAPHERTGSAQKRANLETIFGDASEGGCAFDPEPDWQGDGNSGSTNLDDQNIDERFGDEGLRNWDAGEDHGAANVHSERDDYVDPWAPLNPHAPGTLLIKPYKRGLTQRKKPRLKKRRNTSSPVASRTGVCFPEFLKALHVREQLEKVERCGHGPDYIPAFETLRSSFRHSDGGLPADEADERSEGLDGEAGDSEVEENDNWAGPTFEPQENVDTDILDTSNVHDPPPPLQPAPRGQENEQNCSPYMHMPSFDDERGEEEMSFEELCRAHLDSMLRKLSEAHTRTGLTSRVTKWKNKIEATLVDEDTRPPFDIHEYGDRLLDELATLAARSQDEDEEIKESFTYLVRGQRRDQVARSFSALLQLVNNGNVIIDKGELGCESVCFTGDKPFTVKLLNSQNKHEGMFENMVHAKTSKKASGRSKAPRPPQSTDRSRGKQFGVVRERTNLVSNPRSPDSPSGSRSSLAVSMSPGLVKSSRKRRQTVHYKRVGSPDKENRGASTPLHATPVKLTPDGRYRIRRKALAKIVQ